MEDQIEIYSSDEYLQYLTIKKGRNQPLLDNKNQEQKNIEQTLKKTYEYLQCNQLKLNEEQLNNQINNNQIIIVRDLTEQCVQNNQIHEKESSKNNFRNKSEVLETSLINTEISVKKIQKQSLEKENIDYYIEDWSRSISSQEQQRSEAFEQFISILQNGSHLSKFLKEQKIIQNDFYEQFFDDLKKQQIIISNYIASGGEADIYEGKIQNDQNIIEQCVFRVIVANREDSYKEAEEEYSIVKQIKNPINIVSYLKLIILKKINIIIIVCHKYMQSLKNRLQKSLDIDTICSFIFDFIDGLVELRSYKTLHFDIKPENILIDQKGNLFYSDFGISKILQKGSFVQPIGYSDTYSPQEQIEKEQINHYQSDIYSLGKTFQKLLYYFKITEQNKIKYKKFINDLQDIIYLMIKYQPQQRTPILELAGKFIDLLIPLDIKKEIIDKQIQKVESIKTSYKYEQTKDTNYLQDVNLQYSFINLQLNLYQFKTPITYDKVKNIGQIQLKSLINQDQINFEILKSLVYIGDCYLNLGQYKIALNIYLECSEYIKTSYDNDYKPLIYLQTGICYDSLQDHDQAIFYYSKVQYLYKEKYDKNNNIDIAILKSNQASCYDEHGNKELALKLYQDSLKIFEKLNKTNNREYVKCLNNMGSFYNDQQQFEEAIRFYQKAIDIKQQIIQSDLDPTFAITYNNIGTCYKDLGQISEAFTYFEKAMKIMKQVYENKNHGELAKYLNNMASCFLYQNKIEQALEYYQESLKMKKELQLQDTNDLAITISNIGDCYFILKNYIQSKESYLEVIRIYSVNNMKKDESYHYALNCVGKIFEEVQDLNESLNYYLQSIKYCDKNDEDYEIYIMDAIDCCNIMNQNQIKQSIKNIIQLYQVIKKEEFDESILSLEVLSEINQFCNQIKPIPLNLNNGQIKQNFQEDNLTQIEQNRIYEDEDIVNTLSYSAYKQQQENKQIDGINEFIPNIIILKEEITDNQSKQLVDNQEEYESEEREALRKLQIGIEYFNKQDNYGEVLDYFTEALLIFEFDTFKNKEQIEQCYQYILKCCEKLQVLELYQMIEEQYEQFKLQSEID